MESSRFPEKSSYKGDIVIDKNSDIDANMEIDSDMAVSINWGYLGGPHKGRWGSFKQLGADIRFRADPYTTILFLDVLITRASGFWGLYWALGVDPIQGLQYGYEMPTMKDPYVHPEYEPMIVPSVAVSSLVLLILGH